MQHRVSARFTPQQGGTPTGMGDAGSDLPDPTVVTCVLDKLRNLSLPSVGRQGPFVVHLRLVPDRPIALAGNASSPIETAPMRAAHPWPELDHGLRKRQHGYMKVVKIADAKNNLSRHLAYVRAGGRIRIVERETPVADLVPVAFSGAGSEDDEEVLASLERRGLARRGSGALPASFFVKGPAERRSGVVEALLEERRATR